ncbi:hypothetical protein Ancab_014755, partial [Ancistrocladus abbreviatus]
SLENSPPKKLKCSHKSIKAPPLEMQNAIVEEYLSDSPWIKVIKFHGLQVEEYSLDYPWITPKGNTHGFRDEESGDLMSSKAFDSIFGLGVMMVMVDELLENLDNSL